MTTTKDQTVSIVSSEVRAQAAWSAYLDARGRAERSNDFVDGRAAGLAWRRFMDCYLPADRRIGDT